MSDGGHQHILLWITEGLIGLFMTVLSFFGKRHIERVDALETAAQEASTNLGTLTTRVDALDARMKQEHEDNKAVQGQILAAVNKGNERIDDIWKEVARMSRGRR